MYASSTFAILTCQGVSWPESEFDDVLHIILAGWVMVVAPPPQVAYCVNTWQGTTISICVPLKLSMYRAQTQTREFGLFTLIPTRLKVQMLRGLSADWQTHRGAWPHVGRLLIRCRALISIHRGQPNQNLISNLYCDLLMPTPNFNLTPIRILTRILARTSKIMFCLIRTSLWFPLGPLVLTIDWSWQGQCLCWERS